MSFPLCIPLFLFKAGGIGIPGPSGSLRVQVAESFIEGARAALGGQGQQRRVGQGGPKIGQPRPSHGPENGKFTKEPWNQQLVDLVGGYTPLKKIWVSWDDDYSQYMESHNPVMFQSTNQLW